MLKLWQSCAAIIISRARGQCNSFDIVCNHSYGRKDIKTWKSSRSVKVIGQRLRSPSQKQPLFKGYFQWDEVSVRMKLPRKQLRDTQEYSLVPDPGNVYEYSLGLGLFLARAIPGHYHAMRLPFHNWIHNVKKWPGRSGPSHNEMQKIQGYGSTSERVISWG